MPPAAMAFTKTLAAVAASFEPLSQEEQISSILLSANVFLHAPKEARRGERNFNIADFSDDDIFGCFLITDPGSGFHQVDYNLIRHANNGVFGDVPGVEFVRRTVGEAIRPSLEQDWSWMARLVQLRYRCWRGDDPYRRQSHHCRAYAARTDAAGSM